MPVVNWIYRDADPVASGELRRLGISALAMEGGAWRCRLLRDDALAAQAAADVTVAPLQAFASAAVLDGASGRIVVEIDDTAATDEFAMATLAAGLRRVSSVIVRGEAARRALAAALPDVHPLHIPDVADTWPELAAAALRFGFVLPRWKPEEVGASATELWFAEPGDRIEATEVAELERVWRTARQGVTRAAIADPATLEWLAQSGVVVDWTATAPGAVADALNRASRCVLPGAEEGSSLRRRRKAQRHGVRTVGGMGLGGRACDPKAVGAAWRAALSPLLQTRGAGPGSESVTVLVFLDLVQDLDLALPILDELARRPDVTIRVAVSTWLEERSPRVTAELAARRMTVERVTRASVLQGASPELAGVDAVLCIVETSDQAHARAHALVKRAKRLGLPTFSLQHGLENIGLTMFPVSPDEPQILSDHVLVWFSRQNTPEVTPDALRPRLVHVGRPRQEPRGAEVRAIFDGFARVAAVFENLHWDRYNQAFRRRFIDDCVDFAISFPDTAVLLKPHHAGMWTARNRGQFSQWSPNLVLADPSDPLWEPFTAPSLIAAADLVITTPSTVALDAALARKPVAVAAYGMDLPAFEPLPMLQGGSDWIEFGRSASMPAAALERARFVSRATTGRCPERDAVDFVLTSGRQARRTAQGEGRARSGAGGQT